MVSKGIIILAHMATFNEEIRKWRWQTTNVKTWSTFNNCFHQAHHKQRRAVTTTGKGGYPVVVQNIYSVTPTPPPEKHHEMIHNLNNFVQEIQTQSSKLKGMTQANSVLTRSNSAVMAQWAHMIVTMNAMQAQLKTLSPATTEPTSTKNNYYCWSCRSNYTHGSISCLDKKAGHNEEIFYKKQLVRSEKGC